MHRIVIVIVPAGMGRKAAVNEGRLKPAMILVADRTLSGSYKVLFEGIFATMQTTQVPQAVMRHLISPRMAVDKEGRAHAAALGIRRLEAALINAGLDRKEVICTTPEALPRLLGPWVKVVGVSSSDPLGRGMSNTTTANFWKGQLYTRFWTGRMMEVICQAKERYNFKVIGGGAGAWQWINDPQEARRQGFDTIFEGYGETTGVKVIRDMLEGRSAAEGICEKATATEGICSIVAASLMGIIELSRGCGRGCGFCTMAQKKMRHLPIDIIMGDLETNVAGGIKSVVSGSEDFFRYGGEGVKVNFDKLHELLETMKRVSGLTFMQIDHANVSSVAQLSDAQLREIRRLLTWEAKSDYLWVNLGVESANGRLVAANSTGKIAPYRAEDWQGMVEEVVEKLIHNGFYPVLSIVLGLPGETPADVEATAKLVEYLGRKEAVVFPIFYEPVRADEIGSKERFSLARMRRDHLDLYEKCYEINFRNVPKLFWDNQRAGGVSLGKRTLMRMLGKTEIRAWRKTFARLREELPLQTLERGRESCGFNDKVLIGSLGELN